MLSDEFGTLLDKLNKLQWDSIIGKVNLSPPPREIVIDCIIEDVQDGFKPISQMLETNSTIVNFKNYFEPSDFNAFRRLRISYIQLYFLDHEESIVPTGRHYKDRIEIQVLYPTIFNDADWNTKRVFTFSGENTDCTFAYISAFKNGKL